jgi:predicted unusual protein kinase regulating ubiquinone biosynthesis (AarF/ABC1/UbiB family)
MSHKDMPKNTVINRQPSSALSPKPHRLKTSILSRTLSTAKLSTRLGLGAAKRMLTGQANSAEIATEQALAIAMKLAEEFDGMKGLMMKFGQMASYLGTHMPEEARDALASLQGNSTAMPFESVRDIIERELGQPIEDAFDHFEETAFAAASIGQVHKATLKGQTLAVKVQYPDIERLLKIDLTLVGQLFSTLALGTALDGKALAHELRQHVLEECDYRLEAANQRQIRHHCAAPSTDILGAQFIPAIIDTHSTKRVLTTEYCDGQDFQTFKNTADQTIKNKAALTIFAHNMNSIFSHCYFNGDPHPGNYLFHTDGGVTFLDFGCVKKFDLALINKWKRLAISILTQNKSDNLAATHAMGLVGKKGKFDHDFHWELMNHIYEPYRSPTPFRYNKAYNAKTNQFLLWNNKNRFSARMPPDFLFINRLQWGMAALLADLEAQALWSAPFQQSVYAPATPLFPRES